MSDTPQYRDWLSAPVALDGERILAWFQPSRAAYIRSHFAWVAGGGILSVIGLLLIGRSDLIWAALLGVAGALILRGFFLYSDVMRVSWLLTESSLVCPGNERIALSSIVRLRRIFSDVMIVTSAGRKQLIRYQDDPDAVIRQIEAQK